MERRSFLVMLAAGCAAPEGELMRVAQVGGASAPLPAPPPEPGPGVAASGDPTFDAWMRAYYGRALAAGLPKPLLDRELAGLTADDRVSTLDGRQPEFSKPVGDYIKGVVTEDRVVQGRRFRGELPFLTGHEQRFGVPRDILIAIWALESAFGQIMGDFDVVRSMATLAADGRRRQFAEDQLTAALKIIQAGEIPRTRLKGSWAGAMGQTQFIPTTFLTTAVDADGDGRRDIWSSRSDALGSAANLLSKAGWVRGQSWAVEVTVPPGFDYSLSEGPREPVSWWADKGVRRPGGRAFAAADVGAPAQLIAPAGASGPLFLILPNHMVIRRYNNSVAYALGVGLLADRFGGAGPLATAWPAETPLALADRMAAQEALANLGFDPGTPDGIVGTNTRAALRAWQKSRGLVADGYLSMDMVRRLRNEAAGN